MRLGQAIHFKFSVVLLLVALVLAGCAASIQPIPKNLSQTIRITRVDIKYDKEAFINWWQIEKEYADKKGIEFDEDVNKHAQQQQEMLSTPEAKAFIRKRLSGVLRGHFEKAIQKKFQGSRPVILEVTVKSFDLPSAGRRVLLGGNPTMAAITVIKDAGNGVELAKLDRFAAAPAGNGWLGVLVDQAFSDLHDRVINKYTAMVYGWLKGEV